MTRDLALRLLAVAAFCTPTVVASQEADGERVFKQAATPSCGTCHILAQAGTSGRIGPNLDELRPSAGQVEAAVRDGPGAMPSYRGRLSDAQIAAVAAYVARAAGQ